MMPATHVPEAFVPAFAKLHQISEHEFRSLLAATEVLCQASGLPDFTALASESGGVDHQEAKTLLDALLSMMAHAADSGHDLDQLIDQVSTSEELGLVAADQELLARRIKSLVNDSPVRVLYKGLALALQHERIFLEAGIITDIRPVFGDEIAEGLAAAVLIHSLRVDFIQAGRRDYFHVALDQHDLIRLKTTIERAISKASSLRETLESAGISNLTLQE